MQAPPQTRRGCRRNGFTLIEILMVVAIIGTLATLAMPFYRSYSNRTRMVKAIRDLRVIETELTMYSLREGDVPDSLADIGREFFKDPWGNPYQYLKYANYESTALFRKERFLFPINGQYDLYSKGANGQSEPELSAPTSLDDVIMANDGTFVGLASDF